MIKQLIICDAGPIIHLDELECLTILNFPEIVIPKTVHEEINSTRLISFDKYPNLKIVPDPRVPNDILESSKIYELHQGEIMAISIALESKNAILLTDDSAARLFAANLKIPVHGTIGILLRAVRTDLKTSEEIIEILFNIKKNSSLHITQKLIDESIAAIKKV